MPRIPEITDRSQVAEEARHHADSIIASRGSIRPPYNVLLHSPDIAARTAHLAGYSIFDSSMPMDVKEIAISTAARGLNCEFAFASHISIARDAGVSADTLDVITSRAPTESLATEDRQIVDFVRHILEAPNRVPDTLFAEMESRFGLETLVELTGIIGAYAALACTLNVFEVEAPEQR
jgi:4-carboxymuconolactone decarboxylase